MEVVASLSKCPADKEQLERHWLLELQQHFSFKVFSGGDWHQLFRSFTQATLRDVQHEMMLETYPSSVPEDAHEQYG